MINAKSNFDSVLRKYGHDVLLQRHLNSNSYSSKLEKFTVRDQYPRKAGLSGVEELSKSGINYNVDMIYYFQSEANPRERDRIYESDTRYPSGYTTYVIDYALALRADGGFIAYWTCGVTREIPA